MENSVSGWFKDYKDIFFKSKKYWLAYLVLISITCLSTISEKNFAHPKFEILAFVLIAIIGIFCILYYFLHNSDKELFKVAFVIILCFGIITSFIVPICDVSDETEHLTRAEITSRGVFIPHWTGDEVGIDRLYNHTSGDISTERNSNVGFESIESLSFFWDEIENTVFDTSHDTDKINDSMVIAGSAFEQNPFFGYLPQALGIFIAKILDLNIIWMLWLARIGNLICYACMVSLAVKIVPKFKIPLIAVACIPISIYQAASASIDSMIFGLGLLTVAYFIYLCFLEDNSITIKEIIIFSFLSMLLGLCKLPFLAFVFLILFVPKRKFQMQYALIYQLMAVLVVGLIGVMWSKYSHPALLHSWRSSHNYLNSTQQINYIIDNPPFLVKFFNQIFNNDLSWILSGVFNFFNGKLEIHYSDHYSFITIIIQLFLALVLIAYPNEVELDLKTRLGSLFVLLVVYVGSAFILLLTWAKIGGLGLGICLRYFIPLFALVPVIFSFNKSERNHVIDGYTMVFIIGFMATLILAFATKYY